MHPATADFPGTERYEVKKRLGAGGMGVVYHAWDRERHMDVALKVLAALNPESIYRLKAEFRSLADVSHTNLVGLYDLVSVGPLWFFTMEVVEGLDFLSFVRGIQHTAAVHNEEASADTIDSLDGNTMDGGSVSDEALGALRQQAVAVVRRASADPALLRQAMRQLASGVAAIHRAGKLHRDIKPSNAMVDRTGRVVLLDFGLVADNSTRKRESQHDNAVSGTPAYMSPEQAGGKPIDAAADWYSVGVMLYQALTGQLPFEGTWYQLIEAKRAGPRAHPRELTPDVPGDLADLAMALLHPDPDKRPKEQQIFAALGILPDSESAMLDAEWTEPPFLGRDGLLKQLSAAWHDARKGGSVAVHVKGPPGIGKSALVAEWLKAARASSGAMVVVQGRCHERESVPYKAFDALIDSLTRYLLTRKDAELELLLPREIGALAQIFPVLKRVPRIAQALPVREADSVDKRGVRRRAFATLKALLRKLAELQPLVAVFDDVQWGDPDSVELLASLLEPPDAPAALFVLIYRDDDVSSSPVLEGLRRLAPPEASGFDARDVEVAALTATESAQLAAKMLQDASGDTERAAVIARESQGSPLFIIELVRYRDDRATNNAISSMTNQVSLDHVLRSRLRHLTSKPLELLQIIAVAGRPVQQGLACAAAHLSQDTRTAVARLRSGRFIRTSGDSDRDLLESFHNRIREVVIATLDTDRLRELHRRLALAITELAQADGAALDVDALAIHWVGAGDDLQALHYSVLAARKAYAVHANHDALRHFETVLAILQRLAGLGQLTQEQQSLQAAVQEEAAEIARQAGAYQRSAELLAHCLARAATPQERADVHVGLGRVCQERGDADGAIGELETALRLYGQHPPRNLAVLAAQVIGQFVLHLWHSTLRTGPSQRHGDATLQKRADVMFALIRIYYFVDVAKVTWAGLYAINLARRLPKDGDRALAWSFYGVLLFGIGMLSRSAKWCEEAMDLARRAHDPVAEGVAQLRLGTNAQFANDLPRASRLLGSAIETFQEVGEMWELQTALMLSATTMFLSSDFRGAIVVYEEMGQYGVQLNAIMHQGWALAWAPFCRYLLGEQDAESARVAQERALELSASAKDLANTIATLMHMTNVAVREGQVERSAGLAIRTHEAVSRYLVGVPFLQCAWVDAAEAALFALENDCKSVRKSTLLRMARRGYRKAASFGKNYPYLQGPALRIQARYVAYTRGPDAAEPIFRKALDVLERTPNRWETGVALADAARALPSRRAEYHERARRIFTEIGAVAELRRLDRDAHGQSASRAGTERVAPLRRPPSGGIY